MPIKSYLAHPHDGKKDSLIKEVSNIAGCEIFPAQNKDVLVIVTETDNKIQEEILKEKLDAINSLKLLAMVSGFDTPKKN